MRFLLVLLGFVAFATCTDYIVEFATGTDPHIALSEDPELHRLLFPKVTRTVTIGDFRCVIARDLSDQRALELRKNRHITSVEKDQKVFVAQSEFGMLMPKDMVPIPDPTLLEGVVEVVDRSEDDDGVEENDGNFEAEAASFEERSPLNREVLVQKNAPSHLVRLTARSRWNDITDNDYFFDATGKGVMVYVLDTGVDIDNPQFGGRATRGAVFVEREGDQHGHGTHVAGLIGSREYGVAKEVSLVDVKVISNDGFSTLATVLLGVEWAVKDRESKGSPPAVINLSLATAAASPHTVRPLNTAVEALIRTGIVVVAALGNYKTAVDSVAPAGALGAIVAGAANEQKDLIATFSNHALGNSDYFVFAPGVDVRSLSHTPHAAEAMMTGSSSAAALASGCAAMYLEKGAPPEDIGQVLVAKSTKKILDLEDQHSLHRFVYTPNRMLYCAPLSVDRSQVSMTRD